jgi:hypothetical protein
MSKKILEQLPSAHIEAKKEDLKRSIDVGMEKGTVIVYLEVFPTNVVNVVNIETFEGLEKDDPIVCVGFTSTGKLVMDDRVKGDFIAYRIHGSKRSHIPLSYDYIYGRLVDGGRGADGKRREPVYIYKWEAVASYVGCDANVLRDKCQELLDKGVTKIYVRWLHNLVGMSQAYGFIDELIVSADSWDNKGIDYNSTWNKLLLKKLGSPYRIGTDEVKRKLIEKRNKQEAKEYEDLDVT